MHWAGEGLKIDALAYEIASLIMMSSVLASVVVKSPLRDCCFFLPLRGGKGCDSPALWPNMAATSVGETLSGGLYWGRLFSSSSFGSRS